MLIILLKHIGRINYDRESNLVRCVSLPGFNKCQNLRYLASGTIGTAGNQR